MMSILALIIAGCLVAFSQSTEYINTFVIISIFIFSGAFFFDIRQISAYKKYGVPLSAGYLFRILLLFYDVYTNNPLHLPLVGGALSSDHLRFYNAAVGYTQGVETNYGGFFPRLLGAIFSITGISRLWAEFIVMVFSIFTILVFTRIIDDLDIPVIYRRAGVYLICLLPNYAFLSAVLRRETFITFFVALSTKYFINWIRGKGENKAFILAIVFAMGASLFHGATGLIILCYIFIRLIYSPMRKAYTLEIKNILGALIFFVAFLFIYAKFGDVFFGKIDSKLSSGVYSVTRDAGRTSYAKYVGDAKTPLRMIIFAVPRFLYFMFSPFPWQWRGLSDVITFLFSSCVYLYIILSAVQYIRRSDKSDENRSIVIALLVVVLLGAEVFAWGTTNTGTATRHRDKFIVIYAILFSISQSTGGRLRLKHD